MSERVAVSVMAGAGNTFAVFDMRRASPSDDRAQLARNLCAEPPLGCGFATLDGVLFVEEDAAAEARMVIHNADGSRPEACGNGLRCVARFAREHGFASADTLRIATDAGVRVVELLREAGEIVGARAQMGAPRRIEHDVELFGEFGALRATLVDMGNPHCVLFVDDERAAPVHELGALLERHERFPQRTNVEFAAFRERRIQLRVWERGVGETAACGTGACAAAVAALLSDRASSPVTLDLPGGRLVVDWDGEGDVRLSGPCEMLWTGSIEFQKGARS